MSEHDDRVAIHELLLEYCYLCDVGKLGDLATNVFAEDATIDYGFGPVSGREALNFFFTRSGSMVGACAHCLTNIWIKVGDGEAQARSYVIAFERYVDRTELDDHDGSDLVLVGIYRDRLKLLPEGWRIVDRVCDPQFGPGLKIGKQPALDALSTTAAEIR